VKIQPSTKTTKTLSGRRSFLKKSMATAGTVTIGGALLGTGAHAFGEDNTGLSRGDTAILKFLAAAEIIETDLWQQYNELGGVQDREVPGGSGSKRYTDALNNLDGDMSQYIHDNTDDEFSHFTFINAYLASRGADKVNLDHFRILQGSIATGAQHGSGRLTNLMKLTVDTSWWTKYRSSSRNPDLDAGAFPQAVPGLATGQHPAIPRTDADLFPDAHIQAIANTAAFHFAFIEQGGSSLYPSLAQRVSSPEVLRILLSIGPTETAHFQTWHDKAANAVNVPLAPLTDPTDHTLVFPNLNVTPGGEDFQTNLIMPEPCPFLNRKFPVCSVIRPTETKGAAMGAVNALMHDGLFIGQSTAFLEMLRDLASDADVAQNERGQG
jgi:hypothetical protein